MPTPVSIINLGLAKLGQTRITNISPPRSSLEAFVAENYPSWRDEELSKRQWAFALARATLTQTAGPLADDPLPYQYLVPTDCLRPLRERLTGRSNTWQQRGKYIYSQDATFTLPYIKRVPEEDFDALFTSVLACKIAVECAEMVTQSNQKKNDVVTLYDRAIREARLANAFTLGEQRVTSEALDGHPWVTERY